MARIPENGKTKDRARNARRPWRARRRGVPGADRGDPAGGALFVKFHKAFNIISTSFQNAIGYDPDNALPS